MTYNQLLECLYSKGANCAEVALGRLMDDVEEDTGKFPSWDDEVHPYIMNLIFGRRA